MMRQGAAAVALLLATGCGAPAPPPSAPLVQLSTQNPGANIGPIVDFFRRTCLENVGDAASFQASLAASGWHAVQTQTQGRTPQGDMMPSVWRLDHGQLLLTDQPPFRDCILSIRSPAAPRLSTLRAAMQQAVGRRDLDVLMDDPNESVWVWPDRPGLRRVLTISLIPASPGGAPGAAPLGASINFAVEPIPAPGADRE